MPRTHGFISMLAPTSLMFSSIERSSASIEISERHPSVVKNFVHMLPPTVTCPVRIAKRGRTTRSKGGSNEWLSPKRTSGTIETGLRTVCTQILSSPINVPKPYEASAHQLGSNAMCHNLAFVSSTLTMNPDRSSCVTSSRAPMSPSGAAGLPPCASSSRTAKKKNLFF